MVALTVLVGSLAVSTLVSAKAHEKYRGDFGSYFPTSGDTHDATITGRALMKVGVDTTKVTAELEGLDPALVYSAHLHDKRCADGGGGHYQNEIGGAVDWVNEIWLTTFDTGFGIVAAEGTNEAKATGAADWSARTTSTDPESSNALSVVVHAPGGARVACADLELDGLPRGAAKR